jgi:Ase1/PRC1/MAP65 family protein
MILERLELQISKAKDLEFSRKDVLEKMDRWQAALEEESWLEEYSRVRRLLVSIVRLIISIPCCMIRSACFLSQNENRYNTGKGTHLVLKRAEKARSLVGKMPGT